MNRLLVIISALLVISCNEIVKKEIFETPKGSKNVEVKLKDSLGTVSFSIPIRYDTSFSWIHYSDCGKPCDEQKYRFQPKALPIIKESGWMWQYPKDSIERFTISHKLDFPFHDGDTAKNKIRHNQIKEQLVSGVKDQIVVFDTIQNINGRYYSIFCFDNPHHLYSKKVIGVTTIKSNAVKFEYELLTNVNDSLTRNFINNSLDLIKTIKIRNGI